MRITTSIALVVGLLLTGIAMDARSRRKPSVRSGNAFDFYLLSLSYAPDFCDQSGSQDPKECGKGRKVGYVVHGLWPQSNGGRGPENCGGSPVSQGIVQLMLNYMPTASLIQHEWQTHGTCSGLTADAYFAQVRQAKDNLKIPATLAQPASALTSNAGAIESQFAKANPSYPNGTFRTSCYGNGELQEVRVCLTKTVAAMACPASVQDCGNPSIQILPVR